MRRMFSAAVLTVMSASMLVAVGCSSDADHPNKLTGEESSNGNYVYGSHGQVGQYAPESNYNSSAYNSPSADRMDNTATYPNGQPPVQSRR